MAEPQTFGEFVRLLRERAGISQRELGRRAGVGQTYPQQLERGYVSRSGVKHPVKSPSWEVVDALATALDNAIEGGLAADERHELFALAKLSESRDDSTDSETYGLTPEQARELANLPAGRLLRVLEEVGGIRVRGPASDQDLPAEREQTKDRRGRN